MIYDIKRGNTVVWSGKPTGKQYKVIMQEDRVEIMINTVSALSLKRRYYYSIWPVVQAEPP